MPARSLPPDVIARGREIYQVVGVSAGPPSSFLGEVSPEGTPGAVEPVPAESSPTVRGDVHALLAALGGKANIASAQAFASRIAIEVREGTGVDEARLRTAGYRGAARVSEKIWHLIVGPEAASVAAQLRGG